MRSAILHKGKNSRATRLQEHVSLIDHTDILSGLKFLRSILGFMTGNHFERFNLSLLVDVTFQDCRVENIHAVWQSLYINFLLEMFIALASLLYELAPSRACSTDKELAVNLHNCLSLALHHAIGPDF